MRITKEELKERGLKAGDIYYCENKECPTHSGWRLMLENINVGLTTLSKGSWGKTNPLESDHLEVKKVIMCDGNYHLPYLISQFLRTFDENILPRNYIYEVVSKMCLNVVGITHTPRGRVYYYSVEDGLFSSLHKGNMVVCKNSQGLRYGEVVELHYEVEESLLIEAGATFPLKQNIKKI